VAAEIRPAVTIAGHDAPRRSVRKSSFTAPDFRVYTTEDVIGVELGGALKNVMANRRGRGRRTRLRPQTRARR